MTDVSIARKFMIISDGSDESRSAARFAAMRAKIVGAGLVIIRVADETSFGHWHGLDKQMRREALDAAGQMARELATDIESRYAIAPQIVICDGSLTDAIRASVAADPAIKVLVLGSGSDARPGPLVARIGKGKALADRPLAITVVPGALTDDELAEMGGLHV